MLAKYAAKRQGNLKSVFDSAHDRWEDVKPSKRKEYEGQWVETKHLCTCESEHCLYCDLYFCPVFYEITENIKTGEISFITSIDDGTHHISFKGSKYLWE